MSLEDSPIPIRLGFAYVVPHFQVIWVYLTYWGLCFNCSMRNTFAFDSQVGVKKYVPRLFFMVIFIVKYVEESITQIATSM